MFQLLEAVYWLTRAVHVIVRLVITLQSLLGQIKISL